MTADVWAEFDSFKEYFGDGTIDMDDDVFKCALITSVLAPLVGTHTIWGDLSGNEISVTGYTAGGFTMSAAAGNWVKVGGTTTFDHATDPNWTPSGGSLTCRYAVVYDDTPVSPVDPLVCFSLLDNTPADVVVTAGNVFTVQFNASGILALS